jgi:hypothetical protein
MPPVLGALPRQWRPMRAAGLAFIAHAVAWPPLLFTIHFFSSLASPVDNLQEPFYVPPDDLEESHT